MRTKIKFLNFLIVTAVFSTVSFSFSNSAKAAIIFEDDFSGNTNCPNNICWSASQSGTWKSDTPLRMDGISRWTAYKRSTPETSMIILGAGKDGIKPAWRLGYNAAPVAGALSLAQHLTGSPTVGYDELYVRYQFKFSDDWRSGQSGIDMDYWKWIRLWQGRNTTILNNDWSENEVGATPKDTRYIIHNFGGSSLSNWACMGASWSDNVNADSTDGSQFGFSYNNSKWGSDPTRPNSTDGCLGSMKGLNIQKAGDPYPGYFETYPSGSQTWHTIEYHFKLSTTQAGNGVFELWLDGIKQRTDFDKAKALFGSCSNYLYTTKLTCENASEIWTPAAMTYLNTMPYSGGINFIVFFDNMSNWSAEWGTTPRYLYIDNIVVSTSYIDNNYIPGGGSSDTISPAAPQGLTVQ